MRFRFVVLAGLAFPGCALAGEPTLTSEALVGAWRCGPVVMHGPGVDITVTIERAKSADGTYSDFTTTLIAPAGRPSVTTTDRAWGTWRLEDDVITSTVSKVQFLSSSDPSIIPEVGQRIQDDQLREKSTYRSRILAFTGDTWRSIPVDSLYKEAEVESSCERVEASSVKR